MFRYVRCHIEITVLHSPSCPISRPEQHQSPPYPRLSPMTLRTARSGDRRFDRIQLALMTRGDMPLAVQTGQPTAPLPSFLSLIILVLVLWSRGWRVRPNLLGASVPASAASSGERPASMLPGAGPLLSVQLA
jgi:hypothetical protein